MNSVEVRGMHVVLIHPDIPGNTGNVGRTCVATDTTLHLVGPMGFSLEDRYLKRAGLDYWKHLKLVTYPSVQKFLRSEIGQRRLMLFSRFAKQNYWKGSYSAESVLVFGSETKGLPKTLQKKYADSLYRIPMTGPVRSLNLSASVGIVLYEALRQIGQE